MKTRNIVFAADILLLAGFTFFSCQKEQFRAPEQEMGAMMRKDVQADTYFTYSNNPVYLGDPVTISFSNGMNNSCGIIKIQEWNPVTSAWELVAGPVAPVNGQASYTFTPDEIRNYKFRGSWTRTGSPSVCPGTNLSWQQAVSDLSVVEMPVATFTGEAVSCGISREANYSLTYPGEIDYVKIQGSLVNFTGGDATINIISGAFGWTVEFYSTEGGILEGQAGPYVIRQWVPEVTTSREISVEGPASADPLLMNIQWSSDSQQGTITGAWSVKDADGNTLAPDVPGLSCQ